MDNYFNCKLCDKSIKIKSRKKYLKSQHHKYLSDSIIFRYIVPNPDFLNIENILKNYVLEYNQKHEFCTIICKWTLHFSDTITSVKSYPWRNISSGFYLRNFLVSKIKYFESYGSKFSHISEMNITFITDLRNMTYEYYLTQPKLMLEWKLNAFLYKNPRLVTLFHDGLHPLIKKLIVLITMLIEKINIISCNLI